MAAVEDAVARLMALLQAEEPTEVQALDAVLASLLLQLLGDAAAEAEQQVMSAEVEMPEYFDVLGLRDIDSGETVHLVHVAAACGDGTALRWTWQHSPARVRETPTRGSGRHVLHFAVKNPRMDARTVVWIGGQFHDAARHLDATGDLPFHVCCFQHPALTRDTPLARDVLEACLDLFPRAVCKPSRSEGCLPLHLLAANASVSPAILDWLATEHPAAARTADNNVGGRPFHTLCGGNKAVSLEHARVLLRHWAEAAATPDKRGFFPLHMLAFNDGARTVTPELVTWLGEQHPAAASAETSEDHTLPLHEACARNHTMTVDVARAFVQLNPDALTALAMGGNMPLHLLTASLAHGLENSDVFAYFLDLDAERDGVACKTRDGGGSFVFHRVVAAIGGESKCDITLDIVRRAHDLSATGILMEADAEERVPLHVACSSSTENAAEVVQWMLDAAPQATSKRDKCRATPLHHILSGGLVKQVNLVRRLLDLHPASLELADANGLYPIHVVTRNSESPPEIILEIAHRYPAAVREQDAQRDSPLLSYCEKAGALSMDVFDALHALHPTALAGQDAEGATALHLVCLNPTVTPDMLRAVAARQADALAASNSASPPAVTRPIPVPAATPTKLGNLPLHYLCHENSQATPELARALIDLHPDAVRTANGRGILPLHSAALNASPRIAELIHLLLDLHPDAASHAAADSQCLPLHMACLSNPKLESLALLPPLIAAHPGAVTAKAHHGVTPLHCLAANRIWGRTATPVEIHAVTRTLLADNPDALNLPDERGLMPVQHALMCDNEPVVLVFVATMQRAQASAAEDTTTAPEPDEESSSSTAT